MQHMEVQCSCDEIKRTQLYTTSSRCVRDRHRPSDLIMERQQSEAKRSRARGNVAEQFVYHPPFSSFCVRGTSVRFHKKVIVRT